MRNLQAYEVSVPFTPVESTFKKDLQLSVLNLSVLNRFHCDTSDWEGSFVFTPGASPCNLLLCAHEAVDQRTVQKVSSPRNVVLALPFGQVVNMARRS